MANLTKISESAKSLASAKVHGGANVVRLWRVFNSYVVNSTREAERLASIIGAPERLCWSIPVGQLHEAIRRLAAANCSAYIF